MYKLPTPPPEPGFPTGGSGQAYALDSSDDVVGIIYAGKPGSPLLGGHAVIWPHGDHLMVDLNTLLPKGSGWELKPMASTTQVMSWARVYLKEQYTLSSGKGQAMLLTSARFLAAISALPLTSTVLTQQLVIRTIRPKREFTGSSGRMAS